MQVHGGSSSGEDISLPVADCLLNIDYDQYIQYQPDEASTFEQTEEPTLQGNSPKTPSDSPSSAEAGVGCCSEATWDRQSPANNFTPNAVMASPSTEHAPLQNADLHAENNLTGSPESSNLDTSNHGQHFSNSSNHTIDLASQAAHQLAYQPALHPDQYLQGLGIQYEPDLSFLMAASDDHNQFLMPERGCATGFEDLYHADGQGNVTEGGSVNSTTYPSPEQYARSNSNVPGTFDFPKVDHNKFVPISANTPCSADTPRSTSTPAYSRNSDDSPGDMSTAHHPNFNISKSTSWPPLFKKPAQTLTPEQMVDKDSHRPTMDLVEVSLQHENSKYEKTKVPSMDYRDRSWQGRSDNYEGWTPYVKYADFPDTLDMLRNMRSRPVDYMPDNATIFTSLEQVNEWREKEKLKAPRGNQDPQKEEELPQTPEEKAAIVKLLFKAFKSTVDGQSNSDVLKAFDNSSHSNAHVEAICWQLLEATIERSKGGPLCHAYEPGKAAKSAADRNLSFAQRIDNLINALMWEKSVCVNLFRAPKVCDAVDYPSWLGKRTSNNRNLNNKKAEIAKLGKKKLEELVNEEGEDIPRRLKTTSRGPIKRAKRSREQFDEHSDSVEISPPKRQSTLLSAYTTPVKTIATLNAGYNDHPTQVSPSHSPAVSQYNTSPSQFASSTPSTTASVRGDIAGYNFNGISQPNFPRSIPQSPSPLRKTASLSTGNLPLQSYNQDYGQQEVFHDANDSLNFGDGDNFYSG